MTASAKRISGAQILESAGIPEITGKIEQLTGSQRAGIRMATGVGILAGVVIVGLVLAWYQMTPAMPALPTDLSKVGVAELDELDRLIKQYETLSGTVVTGTSQMFELIVINVLYPLFTLLLGYIFGERVARSSSE